MRIAVISDIHGNSAALDAVLDDIARRGVDRTVNLGDSLSGPLDAAGTAERLIPLNLPTVMGNHDRALIDRPVEKMGLWEAWIVGELAPAHLDWIRATPATRREAGVFLCHGTPASDQENWLDVRGPAQRMVRADSAKLEAAAAGIDAPVLLCGHTHVARIVRLGDGRLVVNPGAVGCPAYLDNRFDPPFVHETGSPDARYAILDDASGAWEVEPVAVPYDPSRMIDIALGRGAESWAMALASGRVTPA